MATVSNLILKSSASLWRGSVVCSASLSPLQKSLLFPTFHGTCQSLGGIRGKKSRGGGQTKNVSGTPGGQKYGMKVYDGQRVPKGTMLFNQPRPHVMPGWNVKWSGHKLKATCHGRAMLTTELMEPDYTDKMVLKMTNPAQQQYQDKMFKHFMHIIPDRQHQYFKKVEEI